MTTDPEGAESFFIAHRNVWEQKVCERFANSIGTLEGVDYLLDIAKTLLVDEAVTNYQLAREVLGMALSLLKYSPIREGHEEIFREYQIDEVGEVVFSINGESLRIPVIWPESIGSLPNNTCISIPIERLDKCTVELGERLHEELETFLELPSVINVREAYDIAIAATRAWMNFGNPSEET